MEHDCSANNDKTRYDIPDCNAKDNKCEQCRHFGPCVYSWERLLKMKENNNNNNSNDIQTQNNNQQQINDCDTNHTNNNENKIKNNENNDINNQNNPMSVNVEPPHKKFKTNFNQSIPSPQIVFIQPTQTTPITTHKNTTQIHTETQQPLSNNIVKSFNFDDCKCFCFFFFLIFFFVIFFS